MLTNTFLRDVLAGRKKLLRGNQIRRQTYIPRYAELHIPTLWAEVKNLAHVADYFPTSFVTMKRVPNREYLFTVDSQGLGQR